MPATQGGACKASSGGGSGLLFDEFRVIMAAPGQVAILRAPANTHPGAVSGHAGGQPPALDVLPAAQAAAIIVRQAPIW